MDQLILVVDTEEKLHTFLRIEETPLPQRANIEAIELGPQRRRLPPHTDPRTLEIRGSTALARALRSLPRLIAARYHRIRLFPDDLHTTLPCPIDGAYALVLRPSAQIDAPDATDPLVGVLLPDNTPTYVAQLIDPTIEVDRELREAVGHQGREIGVAKVDVMALEQNTLTALQSLTPEDAKAMRQTVVHVRGSRSMVQAGFFLATVGTHIKDLGVRLLDPSKLNSIDRKSPPTTSHETYSSET